MIYFFYIWKYILLLCFQLAKKIPLIIKEKVGKLLISGMSRDMIAKHMGIGAGSVSRIADEIMSREIPDLYALREIAVKIKSDGFDWGNLASFVRFSNLLEQMGLSQLDIENLIQYIESHCYKTDQNIHDFVIGINENLKFAFELGVSIYELSEAIKQKKEEIKALENERNRLKTLIQKYRFDYSKIHGRMPDYL